MKRNFESSSTDEERSLGERIADKCYEKYDQLLTGGKPSAKEWTHLASFVRFDETRQIDVLSIGTGTKCLGGSIEERGTNGCLVHDSHAEVLARRSLMRLLYEEILSDEPSDLLTKVNEKYRWNRKWTLALFTSSVPCGLASHRSNPTKKVRTEGKVLGSIDDGQYLSLKPGKGSSTQSLSCTDKIKRWLFQGVEGRLLNQIIDEPIVFDYLIVVGREDLSSVFDSVRFISVERSFVNGPSNERVRPSSIGLSWWKRLDDRSSICIVDGHPLGQVQRLRAKQKHSSLISKASFFRLYLEIFNDEQHRSLNYLEGKSRTSNNLSDRFMENNRLWKRTDAQIFYLFNCEQFSKD